MVTPANADRVAVNALVREGLRKEGTITGPDRAITVLVSRNLSTVKRTRASNYQLNDVVSFSQAVASIGIARNSTLSVSAIDTTHNLLTLDDGNGKTVAWHPDHVKGRNSPAVYEKQERQIAVGDVLRFTVTDRENGIFAGKMARITALGDDGTMTLALATTDKATKAIEMNPALSGHQHIDHAYAMTAHAAQGKTKTEVLLHYESTHRHLSTHRSFLVAITRPQLTVTLYTDNRAKLLTQIEKNTGAKTSALEVLGYSFNRETGLLPQQTQKTASFHEPSHQSSRHTEKKVVKPRYDSQDIQQRLTESVETVVENLVLVK